MSHRCGASDYGDGATVAPACRLDDSNSAPSGFPDGATAKEIEQVLTPRETRRNVDYALAVPVELARIVKEPVAGTDKYRLKPKDSVVAPVAPNVPTPVVPMAPTAAAPVATVPSVRTSSGRRGGAAPDQSGSAQPSSPNLTVAQPVSSPPAPPTPQPMMQAPNVVADMSPARPRST